MRYVLAPLAGFTDAPFRSMATDGGADLTYTEMVSAAGLSHNSSPTRHLMEVLPAEGPVACQLFGSDERELAFAARSVPAERFCELNLNAGCPMTKVTRSGSGAKLVEDPAKVFRLLTAMRENTPLPVTLKTRLGPHPQDVRVFELVDAAERAGAAGVTIHARFTSQMHGGPLHLDLLAETVRRAHIPVTGNGSVVDLKTCQAMAETGVSAIMIGRAALSDPGIFARLKAGRQKPVRTKEEAVRLLEQHVKALEAFHAQLVERFPRDHIPSLDAFVACHMHTHLFRYFTGLAGASRLRASLQSLRTRQQIFDAISWGEGQTPAEIYST